MTPKKILLIEDDIFASDLYKFQLEKAGHEVIQAFDTESGWQKFVDEQPDLVILDLILPPSSGLDLLKKLRTDAITKDVAVVVLTNIKDEKIKETAKKLGILDYIVKTSTTPAAINQEIGKYLTD